jgi:translation initiation factor 1
MDDLLKEIEAEQAKITVRGETRRWSKPATLILGLNPKTHNMKKIAGDLKRKLSTGGTVKDGYILIQGDWKSEVKEFLVKMGFNESSIEVV